MRLERSSLRVYQAPEKEEAYALPAVDRSAGPGSFVIGRRGVDLSQLLPEFPAEQTIDVLSDGHWSLHEMLAYVVEKYAPCDVWITTWGITEEPVKRVLDLVRDGSIRNLKLLLDYRARLQAQAAYQVVSKIAEQDNVDCKMTRIHAKVIVLESEKGSMRIHTSANLTRNLRAEHYNISTHRELSRCNRAWIEELMNGADPFQEE